MNAQTEFIRARVAEDRAEAERADADPDATPVEYEHQYGCVTVSAARVLAQCAVVESIVERATLHISNALPGSQAMAFTLRDLTAIWRDHPDYREEVSGPMNLKDDPIESLTVTVTGRTRAGRTITMEVPRLDFTPYGTTTRLHADGNPLHTFTQTWDRDLHRRGDFPFEQTVPGEERLTLLIRGALPPLDPGEHGYTVTVTEPAEPP